MAASPTSDEERVLDYFWNENIDQRRSEVPADLVAYLEVSRVTNDVTSAEHQEAARLLIVSLMDKRYLKPVPVTLRRHFSLLGTQSLVLAPEGIAYMTEIRPRRLGTVRRTAHVHLKSWQLVAAILSIVLAAVTVIRFFAS